MVDRKILNKTIKEYSLNNYQLLYLDMILHSVRPILYDILVCLISSENDSHKLFAPVLILSVTSSLSLSMYIYIHIHTNYMCICVCICMYKLTYNDLYKTLSYKHL